MLCASVFFFYKTVSMQSCCVYLQQYIAQKKTNTTKIKIKSRTKYEFSPKNTLI